ncbi:hypothetical protein JOM56_011707 [Amanita muscaria]
MDPILRWRGGKDGVVHLLITMLQGSCFDLTSFCLFFTSVLTSCALQEAVSVGLEHSIERDDRVITAYRCHPFAVMHGGTVPGVPPLSHQNGMLKGKRGSMHIFTPTFFGGNSIVGAGIAFAQKYSGEKSATFAPSGNAWNGYPCGEEFEYPLEVTRFLVPRLTEWTSSLFFNLSDTPTNGPLIMEFVTYRYGGHSICMSDPGTTYHTREEAQHWGRATGRFIPFEAFTAKMEEDVDLKMSSALTGGYGNRRKGRGPKRPKVLAILTTLPCPLPSPVKTASIPWQGQEQGGISSATRLIYDDDEFEDDKDAVERTAGSSHAKRLGVDQRQRTPRTRRDDTKVVAFCPYRFKNDLDDPSFGSSCFRCTPLSLASLFSSSTSELLFEVSTRAHNTTSLINKFGAIVLSIAALDRILMGAKYFIMEFEGMTWETKIRKRAFAKILAQDRKSIDKENNSPARIVQVLVKDEDDARNLVAVVIGQCLVASAMFAKSYYEAILNVRVIRTMSIEAAFGARFNKALLTGVKGALVEGCTYDVASGLVYLAEAILFYVGAVLIASGTYTYLQMVEVLNLVVLSVIIGSQLMAFTQKIVKSVHATSHLDKLLSTHTDESRGVLKPSISGPVHFQTSFRKCVAVLYEPLSGVITIGGIPLHMINVEHLCNHVSVISQNFNLFDASSIAENIRYGNKTISDADGYDTLVGENAALISGGQAQRIQIARALARPASILILDECTSALQLDKEAKAEIDAAVEESKTLPFPTGKDLWANIYQALSYPS